MQRLIMKLSILIPVYNVASYLPSLLQELLPSLSKEIEIIFFDDASPDDSVCIIEKYMALYPDACIRILRGNDNVGLTKARGILLNASQAEYIWYIDSDDKIEGKFLKKIISILCHAKPDVLLFDYDVFFDQSNKIKHRETLTYRPENTLVEMSAVDIYRTAVLDGKHYFWNKIFRRGLIDGVVCFDIPAFEDIAYTPILLSKCENFYYFPEVVVHYRIRKDSIAQKMGKFQLFGIKAYVQQAQYALDVMHDAKSRAYLLYKSAIYYYRTLKKIHLSNLSDQEKNDLVTMSRQFYQDKKISEWIIVSLLMQQGMYSKAVKLLFCILISNIKFN